MDKIHVVEVIAGFSLEHPLGGIERFVIELAQSLNKTNFEITVAGLWVFENNYREKWINLLNQQGIITRELSFWNPDRPLFSFLRSLKSLKKLLSSQPINIYHSHDQFGDIMGIILKVFNWKLKLVRTVQNNYEWQNKPIRRFLFTNMLIPLFYDVEIGVNNHIINYLNNRWICRVQNKKAIRIPNASNLAMFNKIKVDLNQKKSSIGIELDRQIIGSVGRLHNQKGYDILIKAFSKILKKYPRALLVLVGDGPLRDVLQKQVEDMGIQESTLFLGTRVDVPEILRIFDIFVSSSRWEGIPGVLLESMAAGVPIVATNVPGTNELIDDKINGLLVETENPDALFEGINLLLSNPKLCKKLVVEGSKNISIYSMDVISQAYEKIYTGISME